MNLKSVFGQYLALVYGRSPEASRPLDRAVTYLVDYVDSCGGRSSWP
jgi:hypothetical protein